MCVYVHVGYVTHFARFILRVLQELHAPPGYVLPVQIDIYSLGVMLYYLWASYTSFRPEDLTPGAVKDALDAYASGCGSTFEKRTSCLSTTSTKLANIVQRMVAKNTKDRFLSMTQVRKELGILRDQEQEAAKKEKEKETDLKASLRGASENKIGTNPAAARSAQTLSTTPSSHSSAMARPASPANSTHSLQSTSTLASQDLDGSSSVTKQSVSSTHATIDDLSFEDRAFVLESILSLSHISNLQELLRAISHALDSILVGHPPEEMAIILWQKEDHLPGGGTWAIMEDKFQPGTSQSTLTWTDLSERRDHMPVLVHKALDSQEPIFSTAIGSRSQLPTIACVPIIASQGGESTLVGAIYLHHLHPRFYFTKRDQDMLILFCQKLAAPLLHSDKVTGLEKQLSLATQRNRFLEDTIAMIQKNEHEVFSWMEALPCFVWAAERDDVLSRRYLSRSWFDFTGLPADTRTGDRWISAMHPDDVAAFQKEVSQSYKTGTYKDCEFRLMRYDGVYRWHLSRAIPVLDHNGAVLKWVGVTIDIDDLYLAQKAELRKKSNFLANMSHELRTPFSGFHGMLSLLGYSDLNEEQQECVFTAKASCEKLLLIIDDLLDFSKLEADKVTLEASPFDLQEVFDEVEDIVEPLASQSSLELGFIKAENVPEVLIGDSNRLKQILLNLVGNAIKFTHSGHVMVRCEVLRRDSDMAANSAGSLSTSQAMDDDKFYFKHEKNGGGQCQSEVRPPNSGRFSSPEPLSQNSIKLMFSVEDTGIGISPEEQEILFSPFSQVDGSATRSYGGSGLGLSICLQLVKLMKGRIGLRSEREKGSTFWFTVQCEQPPTVESPVRPVQEAEVGESTREIKRITRTLGTPRILIASTSGPTITTLLSFLSDFNTEVVNTPLQAASRLEESVANGIRFDFVCWDFPKYDPNHTMMLELQARPNLNNVHFVLLYTANPDTIRRAQSLQLPSSSSPTNPLSSGRKRPHLSQSASLRIEHTGIGGHGSCSSTSSEVPGLSPEKINSLRITCISKPIRRLKLLRAFVEVLDDSARIHGQAVKKVVAEAALNVDNGPHYMNKTQESKPINQTPPGPVTDLLLPPEDPTEATLEKNLEIEELEQVTAILDRDLPPPEPLIAPTQKPDSSDISDTNTPQEQIPKEPEVVQQAMDEKGSELVQHMEKEKDSKEDKDKDNEKEKEKEKEREEKEKDKGKEKDKDKEKNKERTIGHKPPLKHKAPLSSGKNGKLRSNSPKPAKTSKLVTEEATELSLSLEEAKRIAGMRILLAEDNLIAQKVLSKQLELFGLVISCANDGADALTLFKSHPRGYYTLGFFDHHMPNCDGVQATQQIRALEREHAVEVKGPVPRLPLVAVSADIQGTAKEACLNSGMERYVTKPLMQKDLVAIVRHFCVLGDAEASTLAFTPPPEIVKVPSHTTNSLTVPSTVEAMVSAGHVSASIGVNCGLPPMLLSVTSAPTTSVLAGSDKIPAQKLLPKRDLDLSPAALRGLQLIRETTLQDESSKVGGGGNMKSMNLALPIVSSSPMGSSAMALSGVAGETIITSLLPPMPGSHPMQHSNSHYRLSTTHAMTSPTLRGAQIGPLNKANSSPSLSSSYQAGVTSSPIAAPPSVAQPTTVSMATSQGSTTAAPSGSSLLLPTSSTSHLSGPIAAMAAGAAAAAVAVATATVKSVSSAIQDHIPQPSIYAAQGSSVISSNNNLCSWSSLLGNGPSIHQTQQQPQLQHVQQCQDQSLVLQPPYDLHQQQVLPLQPQPQLIYHPAQEVFVPYLHPVEPSVAKEQDSPPMVPGNDGMIGKSSPVTITVTVPDSVPEPLISSTGVSGTLDSTTTGAGTKLPSAPIQLKTWL
ncbi:histidine kinase osmosensor [Mortierella sp. GBA43]|nr:histidine kinase osmosensor [Mortierella sp. GBA43]